jgi:hypothetical protein
MHIRSTRSCQNPKITCRSCSVSCHRRTFFDRKSSSPISARPYPEVVKLICSSSYQLIMSCPFNTNSGHLVNLPCNGFAGYCFTNATIYFLLLSVLRYIISLASSSRQIWQEYVLLLCLMDSITIALHGCGFPGDKLSTGNERASLGTVCPVFL